MENLNKADIDLLYSRKIISYPDYINIIRPPAFSWPLWIYKNFLFLGAALVLAGIVCFFAFNWADMDKFLKLGLPFCGFILLAAGAAYKGLDSLSGQVMSLCAGFVVGVFFAVFGQVYQTGADAWQLFLAWTVLLLPLAALTRFSAMWVLFGAVLNVFLMLYPFGALPGAKASFLFAAAADFLLYLGAEFLPGISGAKGRSYSKGLFYGAALFYLTFTAIEFIFANYSRGGYNAPAINFILFWLFIIGTPLYMFKKKRDITLLGLCAAALATVITAAMGRLVLEHNLSFDAFLMMAVITALVYGAAGFATFRAYQYFKGGKND